MIRNGKDLSVNFCGIKFEHPFILSAAPPTDELDMVRRAFDTGWAGAVLKTTSVESIPVPLVYPMMSGIDFEGKKIMGLGNIDLISKYHIDEVEKRVQNLKKEYPRKVVTASIMGSKKEEWQELVHRLEDNGVDIIECSFSCPQGSMGETPGAMLAQSAGATERVTSWVKNAAKRVPVVIKITPQVTNIVEIARAVKNGGADAICASNTIPSLMGIDLYSFTPYPKVKGYSSYSGLSGSAIKPITLRTIAEIKKNVDIPISATGGPLTWKDAVEMMLVGASNVQFASAVMKYGFDIVEDLLDGLFYYLEEMEFLSASEIIGKSLQKIIPHEKLSREHKVFSYVIEDLCIKCDACYIACRDGGHNAISVERKTRIPSIDKEKCTGCALCYTLCPVSSIKIQFEECAKFNLGWEEGDFSEGE